MEIIATGAVCFFLGYKFCKGRYRINEMMILMSVMTRIIEQASEKIIEQASEKEDVI
jgi:hypothetical protein